MKLVLDAHYSPVIAARLRERGYDVVAAGESHDLRELPDEELLRWAQQEQRVIVTENVLDFMPLHQVFLSKGEHHVGMLFTSPRTFPRRMDGVGHLIAALGAFMDGQDSDTALQGDARWL